MEQDFYEGYEVLSRFAPGELRSYRHMLLEKTHKQVNFIRSHVPHRPLRSIEIGSGNGRLQIALWLSGVMNNGLAIGIELSGSRVDFARTWRRDLKIDPHEVDFVQADILKLTTGESFDLAICITGCIQYFTPGYPDHDLEHVLSYMRNSGAYALFELYHPPYALGCGGDEDPYRTWKELPADDPWMYIFDEYEWIITGDRAKHTKTFIGRSGQVDKRVEVLNYYPMKQFLRLLKDAGFRNVHWAKENRESMVVLVS